MIRPEDIIVDMHTHTLFSKHAYSSVLENMEIARQRGLKYVAITDHYFANGDDLEKKNEVNRIKYLEQRVNGFDNAPVKVIGSAEFNLGQEVYTPEKLGSLKWKPIGLHNWFVDTANLSLDDVYGLFVESAEKGYTSFVHIERELHKVAQGKAPLDEQIKMLKAIVDYAFKKNIWLEVNESSISTNEDKTIERLFNWLSYAKEKECIIYLGTDAHFCMEVGKFTNVLGLLNEIDYPKELILNCNEYEVQRLLTVR